MAVTSAGILLHRPRVAAVEGAGAGVDAPRPPAVEVLIAHMGGPYWTHKTAAAWTIPKGEYDPDTEEPLAAARREFAEELGVDPPVGDYVELGVFRYSSGKRLTIFAGDGTGFAPRRFSYGTFRLEWPPGSGRMRDFPEVDEARWASVTGARELLVKGQRPALEALEGWLTRG